MAKDDDEQTKKSDAEKAAQQAKKAREESTAKADEDDDDRDEGDDGDDESEDDDDDDADGKDEGKDEGDDESEDDDDAESKDDAHDEDEDEDEDGEEEEKPAAAAPAPAAKVGGKTVPMSDDAKHAVAKQSVHDEPKKERPRPRAQIARPQPIEAPPPPPPPVASMGKRIFVFAVVLVGLSVGLYFLPQSENSANGPRFKVPSTNDLTISVIPEDATALACGSPQEVAGKKCEFSSKTDKNSGLDDSKMLKPYTTLDGVQFLAAGLWTQPALEKSKLPAPGTRFGVKCKYVVDGVVKSPLIRWNPTQAWADKNPDWNSGILKDCVQVPLEK